MGDGAGMMVAQERVVDLAGDEVLQAANDVLLAQALSRTSRDVFDRWLTPSHADGGDALERRVRLPVAAAKEAVVIGDAARCGNRAGAAQLREGGF